MRISWKASKPLALLAALMFALAACGSGGDEGAGGSANGEEGSAGQLDQTSFFVQEDYERQLELAEMTPEGPEDKPWLQKVDPQNMADTSEYAVEGEKRVCFSNAGENNPWRVQGATTAQAAAQEIDDMTLEYVDAQADDNQQISDIESFVSGGDCDALIVAPLTADAPTPAVERACEAGLPVIVLGTPLDTDCQTTYVSGIGGYLFGYQGAKFIADNAEPGANVLMLRILPDVAELEWRYGAAVRVFNEADVNVVDVQFTEQDPTQTNQIVTDAIQRHGQIDAVWMDAGAAAISTIEAFENAGMEVPLMVGEDENRFLKAWRDQGFEAVAPTFPNYQWRTSIAAAEDILEGESVPSEWTVPQPAIRTPEERDQEIAEDLGPLFYTKCGCENLQSFPEEYE